MKHEWRKSEKEVYIPKQKPVIVNLKPMKYFTIEGKGNPNGEQFKENIQALYPLAYAVKMMLKKDNENIKGYNDYTVYPLEGIWDLTQKGRLEIENGLNKDELVYKIMIRQPDFVNEEIVENAIENIKNKKPYTLLDKVKFEIIDEGMCVQSLHIGSYDNEKETFDKMEKFCEENNLEILSKAHKEIYISDFRKVSIEKLKTTLRYRVTCKK